MLLEMCTREEWESQFRDTQTAAAIGTGVNLEH